MIFSTDVKRHQIVRNFAVSMCLFTKEELLISDVTTLCIAELSAVSYGVRYLRARLQPYVNNAFSGILARIRCRFIVLPWKPIIGRVK